MTATILRKMSNALIRSFLSTINIGIINSIDRIPNNDNVPENAFLTANTIYNVIIKSIDKK